MHIWRSFHFAYNLDFLLVLFMKSFWKDSIFVCAEYYVHPPVGVDILFLLFPASHIVSAQFKEKIRAIFHQIWYAGLLGQCLVWDCFQLL